MSVTKGIWHAKPRYFATSRIWEVYGPTHLDGSDYAAIFPNLDQDLAEHIVALHNAHEEGGAVAVLLEAIEGVLTELPKSTPTDGSVDPMSYAYSIGQVMLAIAEVQALTQEDA